MVIEKGVFVSAQHPTSAAQCSEREDGEISDDDDGDEDLRSDNNLLIRKNKPLLRTVRSVSKNEVAEKSIEDLTKKIKVAETSITTRQDRITESESTVSHAQTTAKTTVGSLLPQGQTSSSAIVSTALMAADGHHWHATRLNSAPEELPSGSRAGNANNYERRRSHHSYHLSRSSFCRSRSPIRSRKIKSSPTRGRRERRSTRPKLRLDEFDSQSSQRSRRESSYERLLDEHKIIQRCTSLEAESKKLTVSEKAPLLEPSDSQVSELPQSEDNDNLLVLRKLALESAAKRNKAKNVISKPVGTHTSRRRSSHNSPLMERHENTFDGTAAHVKTTADVVNTRTSIKQSNQHCPRSVSPGLPEITTPASHLDDCDVSGNVLHTQGSITGAAWGSDTVVLGQLDWTSINNDVDMPPQLYFERTLAHTSACAQMIPPPLTGPVDKFIGDVSQLHRHAQPMHRPLDMGLVQSHPGLQSHHTLHSCTDVSLLEVRPPGMSKNKWKGLKKRRNKLQVMRSSSMYEAPLGTGNHPLSKAQFGMDSWLSPEVNTLHSAKAEPPVELRRSRSVSGSKLASSSKSQAPQLAPRRSDSKVLPPEKVLPKQSQPSTVAVPRTLGDAFADVLTMTDSTLQYTTFMELVGKGDVVPEQDSNLPLGLWSASPTPTSAVDCSVTPLIVPTDSTLASKLSHAITAVAVNTSAIHPTDGPQANKHHAIGVDEADTSIESEDVLRRHALTSLAKRRKDITKASSVVSSTKTVRESTLGESAQGDARPKGLVPGVSRSTVACADASANSWPRLADHSSPRSTIFVPARIQPVIIDMSIDSSDDEQRLPSGSQAKSFSAGLDQFLRLARQETEASSQTTGDQTQSSTTNSAVHVLPSHKQEEYRRLKEELKRKEDARMRHKILVKKRAGAVKAGMSMAELSPCSVDITPVDSPSAELNLATSPKPVLVITPADSSKPVRNEQPSFEDSPERVVDTGKNSIKQKNDLHSAVQAEQLENRTLQGRNEHVRSVGHVVKHSTVKMRAHGSPCQAEQIKLSSDDGIKPGGAPSQLSTTAHPPSHAHVQQTESSSSSMSTTIIHKQTKNSSLDSKSYGVHSQHCTVSGKLARTSSRPTQIKLSVIIDKLNDEIKDFQLQLKKHKHRMDKLKEMLNDEEMRFGTIKHSLMARLKEKKRLLSQSKRKRSSSGVTFPPYLKHRPLITNPPVTMSVTGVSSRRPENKDLQPPPIDPNNSADELTRRKLSKQPMRYSFNSQHSLKDRPIQPQISKNEEKISISAALLREDVHSPIPKRRKSILEHNDTAVDQLSTPRSTLPGSAKLLLDSHAFIRPVGLQIRKDLIAEASSELLKLKSPLPISSFLGMHLLNKENKVVTRNQERILQGQVPSDHKVAFSGNAHYTSVLKVFQMYRLNPYLRMKEKISPLSRTFSHRIDPRVPLCKFDLNGLCKDMSCSAQHERNYIVSFEAGIQDLLNLCPAGQGRLQELNEQRRKQRMTDDEITIFATSIVRDELNATPPHTILFNPQKSKAADSESQGDESDKEYYEVPQKPLLTRVQYEEDAIVFGSDVRYFMLYSDNIPDMEQAIIEDPRNVQIWIKLAYKKLYETRDNSKGLNEALHVLSLALESNPESEEVWLVYLRLYRRQQQSSPADFNKICEDALEKVPSYEIFMQYVESIQSVRMRLEACNHIHNFVRTRTPEQASFAVLQAVLYRAYLCILSGHQDHFTAPLLETACNKTVESQFLTPSHRLLLGLYCVYAVGYGRLPDGTLSGHHLASLQPPPILLTGLASDVLTERMIKTLIVVLDQVTEKSRGCPAHWQACRMYLALHSSEKARSIAEQWLTEAYNQQYPEFREMFLEQTLTVDADQVYQHCCDVATQFPYCGRLHYKCSIWTKRTEFIRRWISYLYDWNSDGCCSDDMNMLFRKLLAFDVPLNFNPVLRLNRLHMDKDNALYSWLCYGFILQDMAAAPDVIQEVYESALCKLESTEHIRIIWLEYLAFQRSKEHLYPGLLELAHQCLTSVPCKFSNIEGASYFDYSFHTQVIDFVADSLHQLDVPIWLEQCLNWTPSNTALIFRICHLYLKQSPYDLVSVRKACEALIDHNIEDEELWLIYARATILEKRLQEAALLLQKALVILPHSAKIWKYYLMALHSLSAPAQVLDAAKEELKASGVDIHIDA